MKGRGYFPPPFPSCFPSVWCRACFCNTVAQFGQLGLRLGIAVGSYISTASHPHPGSRRPSAPHLFEPAGVVLEHHLSQVAVEVLLAHGMVRPVQLPLEP